MPPIRLISISLPLASFSSVGFLPVRKAAASGFSLIELLAVVLIIGLGISFVSTNIGGNSNYRLRAEAKQFANNVSLIAEEAVLANQQWGVDIFRLNDVDGEQFGYRWLVRNDDGVWELANADAFTGTREVEFLFSPGIVLRLQLDGIDEEQPIEFKREITQQDSVIPVKDDKDDDKSIIDDQGLVKEEPVEPAIWLLSSGEMSVFTLTVFNQDNTRGGSADDGADGKVDIKGDVLGRVTVDTGAEVDEDS